MVETKKLLVSLGIVLAFLTGFLASYAASHIYLDKESPFLVNFALNNKEPGNWISEDNIKVFQDKVVIYVKNALISRYAETGSMLPTLGGYTNGIKIIPSNPEQINIGDIITFEKDNILVIHRVVDKGEDEKGFWFVTKGDNNQETDGKIYFSQVKYVTVALIY